MQETPVLRSSQDREAEEKQLRLLQIQAQAIEELNRRFASGFKTFIENVDPELPLRYWHIEKVVKALDRVANGELKRLMIFMPPGTYKSTCVSRLYPAYHLRKHPRNRFILASYSSDLAITMSRKARENYEKTGAELSKESSAMHAWDTIEGGGFYAVGVGSTITGKRGNVLSLDDYMKSKEEAYSQSFRDSQWDWWKWVWYQRKEADSAFIVMATRWNLDDIAGRLLEQEKVAPEHWHIINLQGRRESSTFLEFPETCTVEDDPRQEGEPLCPEIHSSEQLTKEQALDPTMFAAMFQQNPTRETGEIWKREWFDGHTVPDYMMDNLLPTLRDFGYDWDTAYTGDRLNSASAYCAAGVGSDGNIYVDGIDWNWLEFPELVKWMQTISWPHYIEAKASGKSAAQSLMKVGVYAAEVQVKGGVDKIARAKLASVLVSQGRVFIRQSIYSRLLDDPKQGLIRFPSGGGTELSDVFSQMLNRLWVYTAKENKKPTAQEIWEAQVAAGERGEDLRKPIQQQIQKDWRHEIL